MFQTTLKTSILLSSVLALGWMGFPSTTPLKPQDAPPPATTIKNPVKPTAESQARAKKIYAIDCEMCHGPSGNGKTDLANDMKMTLTDLTDPNTLAGKSDGELFDLIKNGKDKMPAEDGRAKTDEMWNLVIYIRNMSKGQPAGGAAK